MRNSDDSRSKILHLDKESSMTDAVAMYFKDVYDLEVDTANNSEGALRMLKDNNYEVLVSGYRADPIDGSELSEEVERQHPDTSVILYTWKERSEVPDKTLSNENVDYLRKKFGSESYEELKDIVDDALE